MATLQAASRSLWGSSGQKGVWVLGLCDPRRWLQKPAKSLPSLHLPSAQHVPLRAVPHPPPRNFLLQGDSWGRDLGSGVAR